MTNDIEIGIEFLSRVNQRSLRGRIDPGHYVIVGDTKEESINTACHSNIGYHAVNNVTSVTTYFYNGWRQEHLSDLTVEETQPFYDYIVSEPLWKPYVTVLELGLTVSSDAPQNVLQALMISSRLMVEASTEAFLDFNRLLSMGCHPSAAFIVAFMSTRSAWDYMQEDAAPSGYTSMDGSVSSKGNHRPWGLLGYQGISQFIEGKGEFTKPYKEYKSIQDVRTMFGFTRLCEDLLADDAFKKKLSEYRFGEHQEAYRPPNPFAPKKAYTGLTYKEYIAVVYPYMAEKYPNSVSEHVQKELKDAA